MTNREIAARLYLSQKTVEAHISRSFAKLGVQSRVALARRVLGAEADEAV
jgi:DNA-binding NarL/FixJ family response regulator